METIAISKFKATCLAIGRRVKRTGKPIRVTLRGEPMFDVVPAPPEPKKKSWIGCMDGTGEILGDIVGPIGDPNDWEALRD